MFSQVMSSKKSVEGWLKSWVLVFSTCLPDYERIFSSHLCETYNVIY